VRAHSASTKYEYILVDYSLQVAQHCTTASKTERLIELIKGYVFLFVYVHPKIARQQTTGIQLQYV